MHCDVMTSVHVVTEDGKITGQLGLYLTQRQAKQQSRACDYLHLEDVGYKISELLMLGLISE